MADVPCRCTDEVCGHPTGKQCGKPVTVKLRASIMLEAGKFTPEYETGICEECWARVRGKYGFDN
jgi:hypothetical protein